MNRENEGEQEGENMNEYLSKGQTEWVGEEVGGNRERENGWLSESDAEIQGEWEGKEER